MCCRDYLATFVVVAPVDAIERVMQWEMIETDEAQSGPLSEALGISDVCARLLVQRGIDSPESAEDFLRPRLAHLDDPFELGGLKAAVSRIEAGD